MTRLRDSPSAAVRIRVMKRDKFMCTYCGASGNDTELEIDHIIPRAKNGSNHMSNLTTACMSCNRTKGTDTLKKRDNGKMNNGLIDKPIHILEKGKIYNQGVIIQKDGDVYLIQRYSFLDGGATDIIPISKDDLFNPTKCKIYANDFQWLKAYFEEKKSEGLLNGSIEENIQGTFQYLEAINK